MPEAICIGELLIDFVSTSTDVNLANCPGFHKAPGGAPANVAVGLAKLGMNSGFIGKVGADPFGDFLRSTLEENGVDTTYLAAGENVRTTLAFVATRSDGKKDIVFYRNPGADIMLEPDEIDDDYISAAELFHYGSVSLSHEPTRIATLKAIEIAVDTGCFISYDPNLRLMLWDNEKDAKKWVWEVMPYADVAKLAEEEWEFITDTNNLEEGSFMILDKGVELVVVTLGENGCYYNNGKCSGYVEGFKVDVVDPLGAGDGFVSAMLNRLVRADVLSELNSSELHEIMMFANAAGALTTQKVGVIPALPSISEIQDFAKKYSI